MLQEVSVRQRAWLCKNAWRLLSLTLTDALCCVNDRELMTNVPFVINSVRVLAGNSG